MYDDSVKKNVILATEVKAVLLYIKLMNLPISSDIQGVKCVSISKGTKVDYHIRSEGSLEPNHNRIFLLLPIKRFQKMRS